MRDYYKFLLKAPVFFAKYPLTVDYLKFTLEGNPEVLNIPYPYSSSSVINGPLWEAAVRFVVRIELECSIWKR